MLEHEHPFHVVLSYFATNLVVAGPSFAALRNLHFCTSDSASPVADRISFAPLLVEVAIASFL